jgi:hypothetical protein
MLLGGEVTEDIEELDRMLASEETASPSPMAPMEHSKTVESWSSWPSASRSD